MRLYRFAWLSAALALQAGPVAAAWVEVVFEGAVSLPFGEISRGTPISGRIVYDNEAPGSFPAGGAPWCAFAWRTTIPTATASASSRVPEASPVPPSQGHPHRTRASTC